MKVICVGWNYPAHNQELSAPVPNEPTIFCKPDSALLKQNKPFYVPDFMGQIDYELEVVIRINRLGKGIAEKFASRYYDGLNFGALLYIGGSETAFASCADHTSTLPLPLFNPVVMETEGNSFEVLKNGNPIFSCESGSLAAIEEAICKASQLTSLRIGDFVAVELAPASSLAIKSEGSLSFKATFCENEIFNYRIIF